MNGDAAREQAGNLQALAERIVGIVTATPLVGSRELIRKEIFQWFMDHGLEMVEGWPTATRVVESADVADLKVSNERLTKALEQERAAFDRKRAECETLMERVSEFNWREDKNEKLRRAVRRMIRLASDE